MHPTEFWWQARFHTPVKMYGDLTEDDVDELSRDLEKWQNNP
jgi:hypothetical protein